MRPLFRALSELSHQNLSVVIVYQRCLVSPSGVISLDRLCAVVNNKDETLLRYFFSFSESDENKVSLVIPPEREAFKHVYTRSWFSEDDMHIAIEAAEGQVSALLKAGHTEVEVFRVNTVKVTPLPDNSTLFGQMLELH